MLLTRWKLMAGVLGVSMGGLAAIAGQCPKTEPSKAAPPVEIPIVAAAEPRKPTPPAPETGPATLPPLPNLEPVKNPPASSPVSSPVLPASGTTPPTPGPAPVEPPAPMTIPGVPPMVPATGSSPAGLPATPAPLPMPTPVESPPPSTLPPAGSPTPDLLLPPKPMNTVQHAAATTVAAEAKYRIFLKVGEGEPTLEVRSGDHLLLKVVCEKIDVKSSETGQGLSGVKASGKVRFSGFGAEGVCDELNFLAGTGDVAMTGAVKIQVKDKLGRIESELSADSMKYKIDPKSIAGSGLLKP